MLSDTEESPVPVNKSTGAVTCFTCKKKLGTYKYDSRGSYYVGQPYKSIQGKGSFCNEKCEKRYHGK